MASPELGWQFFWDIDVIVALCAHFILMLTPLAYDLAC